MAKNQPVTKSVLDRAIEAASEKLRKTATQVDIAKLAGGIKQPSVSDWRSGTPAMDTAKTFASATSVCVEWFLTGRGPKRPWDTEAAVDPQLAELRRLWERLSKGARDELLLFAQYLEHKSTPVDLSKAPPPTNPGRYRPRSDGNG